jgi:ribosomal protein S11
MAKKKISTTKKKKNIKLPFGKLYVKTTFNNTIVTLTDENGNKISGGGT